MRPNVNLEPADLALDILANQFVDLAAAFSRRDQLLALATLDECATRIARKLRSFKEVLEQQGRPDDVQQVIMPAASTLRKIILEAQEQVKRSPN